MSGIDLLRLRAQIREEERERIERKARRLDRLRQRRHARRMADGTPGDDCIPAGLLLALAAVAAVVLWLVLGAAAQAHILYHRSADDPTRYHADVWPPVQAPAPCDTSTSNRVRSHTITYFHRLPRGEAVSATVPMPGEVRCTRRITVAEVVTAACESEPRLCGIAPWGAWEPEAGDVLNGFRVTLSVAGVLAVRPY